MHHDRSERHAGVLQRNVRRPQLTDDDRVFWIWVRRLFANWAEHLVIVKPETVIE